MGNERADATRALRDRAVGRGALVAIAAAYLVYASIYIFQTSFVIDGVRFFSLFDDAMVSMRYARNLAEGHGFVWNVAGARVEGYTNFLWVCYMAALHCLGLPTSKVSLAVQVSGLALLLATLFVVHALALRIYGRRRVALAAVALTAFYLPLNTWGLQGMEVSVLALLVSASADLATRCITRGGAPATHVVAALPALYLTLGVSTLVRVDMTVFMAVVLGFMLWTEPSRRRAHAALAAASFAVFVLGQTLFRRWYFGDLFPNTYYLKLECFPVADRLLRGAYVFLRFAHAMNLAVFLLPILFIVRRRDDRPSILLWSVFGGQCAYSVYVGGDAWEWWGGANRYLCPAMPLFFVALAAALHHLIERLHVPRPLATYAGAALASLVSVNAISGPSSLLDLCLLRRPLHVAENEAIVKDAVELRSWTRNDATIAVVWAGAPSYFADRDMIDLLGKCDRTIARSPAHPVARFDQFLPGHLKWDYRYSIEQLQPDVVYQLWKDEHEARPILDRHYVAVAMRGTGDPRHVYIRAESGRIAWESVPVTVAVRH